MSQLNVSTLPLHPTQVIMSSSISNPNSVSSLFLIIARAPLDILQDMRTPYNPTSPYLFSADINALSPIT